MVWAQLAALAAGGISAGLASHGDPREGARRRHKMNLERLRTVTQRRFDAAERLGQDQLTEVKRGARAARRDIGRSETSAKQYARDAGVQLQAGAKASAFNRGLSNTTVADSLDRAAVSDTVRRMADVDAQFGELYSALDLQESAAVASAIGGLANLQTARYAAEYDLEGVNYDFWMAHEGFGGGGGGTSAGLNIGALGAAASDFFGGFDWSSLFGGGGGGTSVGAAPFPAALLAAGGG